MRRLPYLNFALLSLTPFLFASCASIHSTNRGEKQQIEMSMHRMRTEIEELKHDLNTQQMQLGIYEGKLVRIDDQIDSLKVESSEKQKSTLEELQYHIAMLEKKLDKFEGKQKEILSDLMQLETHANQTIKALGQYKDKIKDLEQSIAFHNEVIAEIGKLKRHFKEISALHQEGHGLRAYTVKSGDSLQKIAKNYNTSIDALKKINELNDDLILVGQELMVPTAN
ncbi:MAG: LysM peptidoglycan-binding domain-containing protein [Simkaniaceae bacterium]|nr:LysM peptidoglycan-binding domain-containing protein [Simkaniaceae bacterium]